MNAKAVSWQERIAQLTAFKSKYGHLEIPTSRLNSHFKLGGWLAAQRSLYKGAKMKNARAQALRQMGCRRFSAEDTTVSPDTVSNLPASTTAPYLLA